MNKHPFTALAPPRKALGCLITICILGAIILLLSSCSENYSNRERTGVFQYIYSASLVFALPDDLDIFAFFKKSRINRRITGNLIAIHVVKHGSTKTGRPVTAVPVYCLSIPFVLNDDTRTRATIFHICRNELFYFVRSTRIHLLSGSLFSFRAVEQKHWHAYDQNPKSEPEQSGPNQFYRSHGRCLIG